MVRYPQGSDIDRSELVPIVLEKFLKGGIRQLDPALPGKNDEA